MITDALFVAIDFGRWTTTKTRASQVNNINDNISVGGHQKQQHFRSWTTITNNIHSGINWRITSIVNLRLLPTLMSSVYFVTFFNVWIPNFKFHAIGYKICRFKFHAEFYQDERIYLRYKKWFKNYFSKSPMWVVEDFIENLPFWRQRQFGLHFLQSFAFSPPFSFTLPNTQRQTSA